jgi:hypothetical protein
VGEKISASPALHSVLSTPFAPFFPLPTHRRKV